MRKLCKMFPKNHNSPSLDKACVFHYSSAMLLYIVFGVAKEKADKKEKEPRFAYRAVHGAPVSALMGKAV